MLDALEDEDTLLLWSALHRQDIEAVQNLINEGVDVNRPDRNGMTPLLIACYMDNTELVRELLKADVCVNAVNNSGQTGLHMSAKNGNTEIVKLLLKYECRINSMSKYSGMTALHEASQRGHHEVVEILLENGANAKSLDLINKTPEYYAASDEVREVFLKYKDNLQQNNKSDLNLKMYPDIVLVYPEESAEMKEILEKYKDETESQDAKEIAETNKNETKSPEAKDLIVSNNVKPEAPEAKKRTEKYNNKIKVEKINGNTDGSKIHESISREVKQEVGTTGSGRSKNYLEKIDFSKTKEKIATKEESTKVNEKDPDKIKDEKKDILQENKKQVDNVKTKNVPQKNKHNDQNATVSNIRDGKDLNEFKSSIIIHKRISIPKSQTTSKLIAEKGNKRLSADKDIVPISQATYPTLSVSNVQNATAIGKNKGLVADNKRNQKHRSVVSDNNSIQTLRKAATDNSKTEIHGNIVAENENTVTNKRSTINHKTTTVANQKHENTVMDKEPAENHKMTAVENDASQEHENIVKDKKQTENHKMTSAENDVNQEHENTVTDKCETSIQFINTATEKDPTQKQTNSTVQNNATHVVESDGMQTYGNKSQIVNASISILNKEKQLRKKEMVQETFVTQQEIDKSDMKATFNYLTKERKTETIEEETEIKTVKQRSKRNSKTMNNEKEKDESDKKTTNKFSYENKIYRRGDKSDRLSFDKKNGTVTKSPKLSVEHMTKKAVSYSSSSVSVSELGRKKSNEVGHGKKEHRKSNTSEFENSTMKIAKVTKSPKLSAVHMAMKADDSHSSSSVSGSRTSLTREVTPKKPQKEKVILKDHTMDFSDKHRERMKVNVFDRLLKK